MPMTKIRLEKKIYQYLMFVAVNAAMMINVVIALAAIYTFVSKNVTFSPAATVTSDFVWIAMN
jgi:hypothetical protein